MLKNLYFILHTIRTTKEFYARENRDHIYILEIFIWRKYLKGEIEAMRKVRILLQLFRWKKKFSELKWEWRGNVWSWVPKVADLKVRLWVRVVYLEEYRNRGVKPGKWQKEGSQERLPKWSDYLSGVEAEFTRESVQSVLIVAPSKGWGRGGIHPLTSVHHWLGTSPKGVSSLTH